MDSRTPTQHERSALLHFEKIYEEWRLTTDAWLAAEILLWTETVRGAGSPEISRMGAEATRLHDMARTAYLRVVDALTQAADGPAGELTRSR